MDKSCGRQAASAPTGGVKHRGAGRGGGRPADGGDEEDSTAPPPRRAAVPRRSSAAAPSLLEEEVKELRDALTANRHEKDVLQCEVHSLQLQMETMRELIAS